MSKRLLVLGLAVALAAYISLPVQAFGRRHHHDCCGDTGVAYGGGCGIRVHAGRCHPASHVQSLAGLAGRWPVNGGWHPLRQLGRDLQSQPCCWPVRLDRVPLGYAHRFPSLSLPRPAASNSGPAPHPRPVRTIPLPMDASRPDTAGRRKAHRTQLALQAAPRDICGCLA